MSAWTFGHVLQAIGICIVLPVCLTGGAVALFSCFGFRMACPFCQSKCQLVLLEENRRTLVVECDACGLVYGDPLTDWKLQMLPPEEEEEQEPPSDTELAEYVDSADGSPHLFFERVDNYRQWQYVLTLLLVTPGAVFGGWVLVLGARQFGWGLFLELPPLVFGLGFLGMFGVVTALLGYRILFAPRYATRVDTRGIQVDAKRWSWQEIKSVEVMGSSEKYCFLCFRPKRFGYRRQLHLFPRIDYESAGEILWHIETFIRGRQLDVEVG